MKYFSAGMCLCVYTHLGQKIKSRLEIVGVKYGIYQRLNRVVELECFCFAEIDCVVAKNNEAVEGQKDYPNPPFAQHSSQGLTPFV